MAKVLNLNNATMSKGKFYLTVMKHLENNLTAIHKNEKEFNTRTANSAQELMLIAMLYTVGAIHQQFELMTIMFPNNKHIKEYFDKLDYGKFINDFYRAKDTKTRAKYLIDFKNPVIEIQNKLIEDKKF